MHRFRLQGAYHTIAAVSPTRTFEIAWYAYGYVRELVLIYPTYAIMMLGVGITPLELSTLFIIWAATALVLEVPSGTLADLYSRKRLLIISGLLKSSAFVVWLIYPHFAGFAMGFVLWGTGSSLASGTAEALVYDTLHARGEASAFTRIYGRGVAANSMGVATALLVGGAVAESGFTAPLLISMIAPLLASAIVLFAIDEIRAPRLVQRPAFTATLFAGIGVARADPWVTIAIAAFAIFVGTYGSLEEYIGPLLDEKPGITLTTIGIISAVAYVARSIGVAFAHRLGTLRLRTIVALFGLAALPLAVTQLSHPIMVGAAFGAYFSICAAAEILLQGRLQSRIQDGTRATVTSLSSMAQMVVGILLFFAIGSIAQVFGWHTVMAVATGFTAIAAMAFFALISVVTNLPAPASKSAQRASNTGTSNGDQM